MNSKRRSKSCNEENVLYIYSQRPLRNSLREKNKVHAETAERKENAENAK